MSDRAYALRFISGKYQGGEYPLSDAGELVIGRSSEQDMVLIEDMVSRTTTASCRRCSTAPRGAIWRSRGRSRR